LCLIMVPETTWTKATLEKVKSDFGKSHHRSGQSELKR